MIEQSDNPPAAANPEPVRTAVIQSDVALNVTVTTDDGAGAGGRWFRLLNWLIDSGAFSRLSPAAAKTLVVLARHADQQGLSCPSLATILAQTGLRKSAVYEALTELRSTPDRLLDQDGRSQAWVVFPGRPFAQRRTIPAPPDPFRYGGRFSAVAESGVRQGGRFSATAEFPPTPPLASDLRAACSRSDGNTANEPAAAAAGEAAQLLTTRAGGGFSLEEARRLVLETGASAQAVQDAIDSAHALKRRGKLKSTTRKFVAWNLRTGRGLFDEASEDRDRARKPAPPTTHHTPAPTTTTPPPQTKPADPPGHAFAGPLPVPPWRRPATNSKET